jgi:hypothetical protein
MHVPHEIGKLCVLGETRDLWCADLFRGLAVTDNDTGSLQTDFDRRDSRHLEQRHS